MKLDYPLGKGIVQLVSTEWLAHNLGNRDLMILDIQPDIYDYIQEHIPGAVYMNEGLLRTMRNGLPGNFIPGEAAEMLFSDLGLAHDAPVVVYTSHGALSGAGDGISQFLAAYALARFGHRRIYILDGGLDQWKNEGRILTREFPRNTPAEFSASLREDLFITYEELLPLRERRDIMILDARPFEYYQGGGPWSRPGHIPGAVSLPWSLFVEKGNSAKLKSEEAILSLLTERDVTSDKMIVCMCGTGREASGEFLFIKYFLGFPWVRLYEGSYVEWQSMPENPVATGEYPYAEQHAPVPF